MGCASSTKEKHYNKDIDEKRKLLTGFHVARGRWYRNKFSSRNIKKDKKTYEKAVVEEKKEQEEEK